MENLKTSIFIKIFLLISITSSYPVSYTHACTRSVYLGLNNTILTARSMDWGGPIGTHLWVFPKAVKRSGAAGTNAIEWTSKYGSLIASAFDVATADGINEKGLVANLLYLAEAQYPNPNQQGKRKPLSISLWAQYALDNFATVTEAVEELSKENFYVVPTTTPDGHPGQVHLSLSDPTGDSAIFEYINGKLVIHHGKQYQVMTNSPTYDQQLALNTYWQEIGGLVMLPGTSRAADRFVRASFYINSIPQTEKISLALAGVFSVIRNASAPLGLSTPGKPNIAATLWRSVSDQKNLIYYFETTTTPNVFWVALKDIDFTSLKQSKKLPLSDDHIYAGNVAKQFVETSPFEFLSAAPAKAATTFTGPTELFSQEFKDLNIKGPAKLDHIKADTLTVQGPLNFSQLKVSNKADISGACSGEGGEFTDLIIHGSFWGSKIKIENLLVVGEVALEDFNINGNVDIKGPLKAKNGSFNNISAVNTPIALYNVTVNNIDVKNTPDNKGLNNSANGNDSNNQIKLAGDTVVSGNITFESGNGVVFIRDKTAQLKGKIIGGMLKDQ